MAAGNVAPISVCGCHKCGTVSVVGIVMPLQVADEVFTEAKRLGLERIWLPPGEESGAAIDLCQENDIKVVRSACVMMN